jgi:hypothetical protein
MPLLVDLMMLYEKQGYKVTCGLDPQHTHKPTSEYAWLWKDYQQQTENLGIALKELYFLECALGMPAPTSYARPWKPRTILVIGNSFGWSTFALALLCPQAHVYAVDIGDTPFTEEWIDRSNQIAEAEALAVTVIKGASPHAVDQLLGPGGALEGQTLDLVLIDGLHSPEQVGLDLTAVLPALSEGSVVLCHDAVLFGLTETIGTIAQDHALKPSTLWSTPSGIVVLTKSRPPLSLIQACAVFGGSTGSKPIVDWMADLAKRQEQK